MKVCLLGPPNAGKTTLFNWMTGSKFRTVNYAGSTVDYRQGTSLRAYGEPFTVVDTPGIRSLRPNSPDEKVAVEIVGQVAQQDGAVIVCPVDVTQLSRHLLLVQQLKDQGHSVIVAVTMMDLLRARGENIDLKALQQWLQVPVVAVDGRMGGGVIDLVRETRQMKPSHLAVQAVDWSQTAIETFFANVDKKFKTLGMDPWSLRLDGFLMHPVLGLFLFVGIMFTLFSSIFWLADPLMGYIDDGFGTLAATLSYWAPNSLLMAFFSDGLVTGVGAVLVFVPQIFILFIGLGILEDSGYLSRAATLVDKPLSWVGLNGRAFVPLLSGYACAIPAMLAARTISSRKQRLLALFIIPLMSCSARLPVYALLLGFLFGSDQAGLAGLFMTAIFFGSALIGGLAALIAQKFIGGEKESFFLLELPTYRRPHIRVVITQAVSRAWAYVKKAGPAIVVISLLIWAGTTFPNADAQDAGERLRGSYASYAGQALEPVMAPMGVDWRVGVGLLSAFAAREVFVSAMALTFQVGDAEEGLESRLLASMRTAVFPDGRPIFTVASVAGLILFFMIALQCMTTYAVARKESGVKGFAMLQLLLFNLVAYVLAVVVVQILTAMGLGT